MYCKNCNGNLQPDFFDVYGEFCDDQCRMKHIKDQEDKRIGNFLTWLIVAFLVGAIVLWAIPAKAYHPWMMAIEAIVCEELADAITIVDIEVDGTVDEYNAVVGSINERVACLRMLISVKKKANTNDLLYSRKWEGKILGVILVISGNGERGYAIVHTVKTSRSESA